MTDLLVTFNPVRVNQTDYTIDNSDYTIDNSEDLPLLSSTKEDNQQNTGFIGWRFPTATSQQDLSNMSFEDLIRKHNLPIQITSGYRGANGFRGGKTKSGKQSNHNKTDEHGHPMAYDIQPLVNGKVDKSASAFANLRQMLANNTEVREWFKQRNWGILDETTPEMMRKTGATGAHFHIGPDSSATRFS